MLDTNLAGAYLVTQKSLSLLANPSSVVFIGSRVATVGVPLRAHYTAAKAGLIGLTRSLSKELGPRGVRVNVLAPGPIETEAEVPPEVRQRYSQMISLGRLGPAGRGRQGRAVPGQRPVLLRQRGDPQRGRRHLMTFRVMLRMQIHPGMERDFEQKWYAIGDGITGHPANLGQWLSRSAEEEGVYYVDQRLGGRAPVPGVRAQPAHVEHRTALHPYRSGGSMTTMSVVYTMTGAGADAGAVAGAVASS